VACSGTVLSFYGVMVMPWTSAFEFPVIGNTNVTDGGTMEPLPMILSAAAQ
jgi:hypothetical protein